MDGMSVASGIAGLIALALQVSGTIVEFSTAIKDQPKNVKELQDELELLATSLSQLKVFLEREEQKGRVFDEHSVLLKARRDCYARIERIQDKLKQSRPGKLGRALDRVKWPFEQKDILQMVENLRRFKDIFNFAVTLEGLIMLSKNSDDVAKGLKDIADRLRENSQLVLQLGFSTKEITEKIERFEQILTLVPILESTAAEVREISQAQRDAERLVLEQRTAEILDWLCPKAALKKHRDIQLKRTEGTGKWFLQHKDFRNWAQNQAAEHDLLCVGGPGVGKTVLSSLVFDHLNSLYKDDDDVAVVYYYCDYSEQQAQTPLHFARSLLRQLSKACNSLPSPVAEFYQRTRNDIKDQTWFQELQSVLQRIISTFSQCFFVIDALDETEPRNQRLGIFRVLDALRASDGLSKTFATTRPHVNIEDKFQDVVKVEVSADQQDLRNYLGKMIDDHVESEDVIDEALKKQILDKLCGNAQGMFLLPALQIRNILDQVTKADVKRALENLSADLSEVFNKTIERIRNLPKKKRDFAFKTLMWISHAKRALTVDELRHAMAVRFEDGFLDPDHLMSLRSILDNCCGLVVVDSDSSTVRFVHYSLEEYLRDHDHGLFKDGDLEVTRVCLKYMTFDALKTWPSKSRDAFKDALSELPLLNYACLEWGFHAQNVDVNDIKDLVLELLSRGRNLFVVARVRDLNTADFRKWTERMNAWAFNPGAGISLAASFGLTNLVRFLISQMAQPVLDARNMYGSTPLHEAAMLGYESTAEVLIAHGANLLDTNKGKSTPIYLAVGSKQISMVETLLKYGRGQLDLACKDGWTLLHKAADLGSESLVTLLLQAGAVVAAADDRSMTPLHLAARRGHLEIVKSLVLAGAPVHVLAVDGLTPLDFAATRGHTDVVKFLLDNRGVINHKGHERWTPVARAARGGHASTVALLLDRGADLLVDDHKGNIPFLLAVRSGRIDVVSMILNSRPAIKRDQLFHKDRNASTARVIAFYTAHFEIHKSLRAAEREFLTVEPSDSDKLTAAIEEGSISDVMNLVTQDKSLIDGRDEDGQPPLHVAIQENRQEIAEVLLDYGAGIESKGYHGWHPLHIASSLGNLPLVELCLKHKASVHSLTASNQTPLHKAASSNDSLAVVQRLVTEGADPTARNDRGMTPLHVAAHQNQIETVRFLVNNCNANVLTKDRFKDSPATWAERSGHLELLAFLKEEEKRSKHDDGHDHSRHLAVRSPNRRRKPGSGTHSLANLLGSSPSERDTYSRSGSPSPVGDILPFADKGRPVSDLI